MTSAGAVLQPPATPPPDPPGVLGVLPDRLTTPLLLGAAGAAVVFPLALVVTGSLLIALVAAAGAVLAALTLSDPLAAVLVFVAVEVSQTGAVLQGLGVPSPLVLTQLLTIVALAVAYYQGRLRVVSSPVLLGAAVLLASRAASLADAVDPAHALETVVTETRDMATLVCTFLLLWMTSGTRPAIRACVLVLAVLAALSGVQEYLLDNRTELLGFSQVNPPDVGSTSFRHLGPVGDPNFWGRVLLMFLPFSAALALGSRSALTRLGWWGTTAVLLLGIFLSQSRGAFLSAAVALLVLLLMAGWRYARWLALAPLLVPLVLALPGTGSRLATLSDLRETSAGGGDLSLVLRLASQEAGLRMFEEHPLLGVGAGNYEQLTPRFERGLSFATVGELGKPLAPHNAFLEFAAEGGVVGLLGFVFFLGTLFFAAGRAWAAAALRAPPGRASLDRLLAAASLAALTGWCVASIVLHVRQFRTLLVLCAIIAVLDATRTRAPLRRVLPLRFGQERFVAPWAGLLAVGLAGGVWLAATGGLSEDRWHAEAVSVVTARGTAPGPLDAYHYDLLTRGQIVPTLAEVVATADTSRALVPRASSGVQVRTDVRTSPRSADVLVVVDGDDEAVVVRTARELSLAGARVVDGYGLPFQLEPVPFERAEVSRVSRLRAETAWLVGAGLLLAGALVWSQFQVHYRAAIRVHRLR